MKHAPQPPTPEDIALIEPNVILPLIIAAFKRDRRVLAESNAFKTPDPYVALIDEAIAKATADLSAAKRDMYRRGLHIVSVDKTTARYMCRGYSGELAVNIEAGTDLMREYLTHSDTTSPVP